MRLKLSYWISVFLSLVIIISNVFLYFYFKYNILEKIELRLINRADNILLRIAEQPDVFNKNPNLFIFPSKSNVFDYSNILVQFMDNKGRLISKSPALKKNVLPLLMEEKEDIIRDIEYSNKMRIKIHQKVIGIQDLHLGYILTAVSMSQMYAILNLLKVILIIVTLIIIIFVWLGISTILNRNLINNQKKFLSFASHELRTPLSVISGSSEVALMNKLSEKDYKDTLSSIKEEADWMSELISNLLSIFRHERGIEKVNKKKFNLGDLVTELAGNIKKRHPQKNIILNLSEDSQINGDPHQLRKAFRNIIENAVKYTSDNGKIVICIESYDKKIAVNIEDNGVGIHRKIQKNVFDSFYTQSESKDINYGLGLSIAKWVIESHGGKIILSSEPGAGSKFSIILFK